MKIKKILLNTLVLLTLLLLVGCNITMYKVTFEVNGGSAIKDKTTAGYVARPTEPTKEGFEFAGWYIDSELTQEFDFKNKIDQNITLYAKWTEIGSTPSGDGGGSQGGEGGSGEGQGGQSQGGESQGGEGQGGGGSQTPTGYTVTFDSNGGSTVENKQTVDGKITAPTNPEKEKYNFEGWFTDSALTTPFDFNSTITSDITLYAKWSHNDNVAYSDGTFSSEVIDPYILAMDFSSLTVANADEYALYLDYAVLNKLTSLVLTLTNPPSSNEEFSALVNGGMAKKKISATCSFNFNLEGNKLTTTFAYPEMATTSASAVDEYTQVPFVCVQMPAVAEARSEFPIDEVTNTYAVTDSDQLCYVLERGYKPTFTSDSCSAKRMYDAARLVLSTLVDDEYYSDIEKLHAIYEWLIANVTYDKTLLNYVINDGEDLRKYKGFYLEGVFEDHRAVCDGISKAFMVMARIEGIECVQVSGTANLNGVGHAWNKVRLNGRWYIVDATGGGVCVGDKEMLTHRVFMCNDEYYSSKYTASEYTNLIADSEYSIYYDLKYTYNGLTHDFCIDDIDELADILAYFYSLHDSSKTIDFYYNGDTSISSAIHSAMQKAHLSGSYSTVQVDGSIIYKIN